MKVWVKIIPFDSRLQSFKPFEIEFNIAEDLKANVRRAILFSELEDFNEDSDNFLLKCHSVNLSSVPSEFYLSIITENTELHLESLLFPVEKDAKDKYLYK